MRIACDVQGTLNGSKGLQIQRLIMKLQELGHEITIWSNVRGYALDAVRDKELHDMFAIQKTAMFDLDNDVEQFMDLAIEDDTRQEYLSSKRFLWVHDIPEDFKEIDQLAESINSENWEKAKVNDSTYLKRLNRGG